MNAAQCWLSEAERAMQMGEADLALAAYSRALELQPNLGNAWFNSGWLQKQLGNEDRALVAYANAIAHGVERPEEAHLNRAAIYSEHFQNTAAAEQELHAALELSPSFVPGLHSLGVLQEDQGLLDAAQATYEKALCNDAADARSSARLAMIQIARGEVEAAIIFLERILASTQEPRARAEILFALGNAFDAAGEDKRAFQAIEAANWLTKTATFSRYDRAAQEMVVNQLISTKMPEPLRDLSTDTATPIFICGMFRSGSTLAETILSRHSCISPGGELSYFPRTVATRLQPYPRSLTNMSDVTRLSIRDGYSQYISSLCLGNKFITDKRCDNFIMLGLIRNIYSDCYVIHSYRHPLDNILSVYFLYFDPAITYGFDLEDIAHYYVQYRKLFSHWDQSFHNQPFRLDYDKLTSNSEYEIDSMLSYLNLDREELCLQPSPAGEVVRTPSSWHVRQPLHRRSSGRWRRYERQLKPAIDILLAAGIEI